MPHGEAPHEGDNFEARFSQPLIEGINDVMPRADAETIAHVYGSPDSWQFRAYNMPERLKEANDRFPDLPADLRELDHDGQIELFNAAAAWLANTEVEEKPDRSTPQNVKRTRTVYLQTADGRGVKVQEVQEDERVTPLGGQPRLDHIEPVVSIDLQYNPGERAANIPAPMLVREGYNKTYASFPILGHDAELIISSLKDATRITEDEYRKLVPAAGNGESAGSRAVSQQNRVVVGNQRGQAVRDEWEADARARRRAANGARDAA